MKHSKMKLLISLCLAIVMCLPILLAVGCDLGGTNDTGNGDTTTQQTGSSSTTNSGTGNKEEEEKALREKIGKFYDAVVESQTHLDIAADTIYNYWYEAIYKDKYAGSIDLAIAFALADCEEDIDFVKTNETTIQSLYKDVRDSKLKNEIREVMSAYGDYYEFVINVSGSFKSYSENKETYKKALATSLKHLSLEL